jgi:transposase InsO family protein
MNEPSDENESISSGDDNIRRRISELEQAIRLADTDDVEDTATFEEQSTADENSEMEPTGESVESDRDTRPVPKYTGRDFAVWKAQVERVIIARGYSLALTSTFDEAKTRKETDKFLKADAWVQSLLITSVDNTHARPLVRCTTAKDMWEKLVLMHESKSDANALLLQQKFYELKMEKNENVQQYVARGEYIKGQLDDIGVKTVDEVMLANRIVMGLPKRFISFISSWMRTKAHERTLKELVPKLLAEEEMLNKFRGPDKRNEQKPEAMSSESRQREGDGSRRRDKRSKDNKPKSEESKGQSKGKNGKRERVKIDRDQCANCFQKGHWRKDCPNPKAKGNVAVAKTNEAQVSEAVIAIGSYDALSNNVEVARNDWLLDSGASEHMTFDKSEFVNYRQLDEPIRVRFGNDHQELAIGIGDVKIIAIVGKDQRKPILIKDALYIPKIKRKLISVSATTKQGCTGTIEPDKIVIRHGDNVRLIANKEGSLYRVMTSRPEANMSTPISELSLWHQRLAHVNKRTIVKMAKDNVVDGLPEFSYADVKRKTPADTIDCEPCMKGKQARRHFPRRSCDRATVAGERVHADICGPIGTETIGKNKYFVLIKDEFTNYRYVYFIRSKEEVFDCLRRYFAEFEAESKHKVLKLVSDCGSEFTSKRTKELLLSRGIAQEFSAPFTPEQNGFVERDNRTIMEAARSMLYHKSLPEKLWGEAVMTAVYVVNRTINERNQTQTPFEKLYGRKPRVDHMRVFGSLVYMKQQEKKRSGYQKKLEARAAPMVMVGYERDYTYRLYEPDKNQVVKSREVYFDETKSYNKVDSVETYKHLDNYLDSMPHGSEASDEEFSDTESEAEAESDIEADDNASEDFPQPTESRYGLQTRLNAKAEALVAFDDEPQSYKEAISGNDAKEWNKAMQEEYKSLVKNKTWTLMTLPPGRSAIKCKWVFKIKRTTDGNIERYKARLVACGYSQKPGIDYKETFSPVVRLDSVRIILALVAKYDLELIHFDVKTAFLNGSITENIYMQQPEGFEKGSALVCKLNRSLYGLKQASKVWNDCFVSFLKEFHLEPLQKDTCILVRKKPNDKARLIIAIYVDDGLACSDDVTLLDKVVKHLSERFDITVMEAKCFVGLQIHRDRTRKTMFINQQHYIEQVVKMYHLEESKDVSTPLDNHQRLCIQGTNDGLNREPTDKPYREVIGSLMYAMLGTRPDISFAVNVLARYCQAPRLAHWNAAKRVIQYLNTTKTLGIVYNKGSDNKGLSCFVDSDFAADIDTRKSTTGALIMFDEGPIIWKTSKQSIVATSTTEAEFIAASVATKETLWAQQLLGELGEPQSVTDIYIDNQGAIKVILNNQVHPKTKHIDVKYMFLRDVAAQGLIRPVYVQTENQRADILTKALARGQFQKLRESISIMKLSALICTLALATSTLAAPLQDMSSEEGPYRIILALQNPCRDLPAAYEIEKFDDPKKTLLNHYNFMSGVICDRKFDEVIQLAEQDLQSCSGAMRQRRSLIEAGKAVLRGLGEKLSGVGVTNFVKSEFSRTMNLAKEALISEMSKQVSKRTKSFIVSPTERRPIETDDVRLVSESAAHHPTELAIVDAMMMPRLSWAAFHTNRELVAGGANIKAIRRHCLKRELATRELNEMLGSDILGSLLPEETYLNDLSYDRNTRTIEIVFSERNKTAVPLTASSVSELVSIEEQKRKTLIKWFGVCFVALFVIIVATGIVGVIIFRGRLQREADNDENERRQSTCNQQNGEVDHYKVPRSESRRERVFAQEQIIESHYAPLSSQILQRQRDNLVSRSRQDLQ